MNYNKLKCIAGENGYTMEMLAEKIGISTAGLKKGIESVKLGWNYICKICDTLSISPNQFFGWEEETPSVGSGNFASHITGGNTQNSNEAIKALKDQLKEKDKQIDRLLKIIEKNKMM